MLRTGLIWAGLVAARTLAAPVVKPDILLLMPDQMRGDCLSAVGHPVVRTPHLDKLASEGALFRRAYTTVPSCIPARHSLLTGLYPQTSGVVGFKGRRITFPTMPQLMADAGYLTVLVGREMHQVPQDEAYGYQRRILGSTYTSNDDYDRYLRTAAADSGGIAQLMKSLEVNANGWEAHPWPLAEELHPTAWIVRESRKVLAEAPTNQCLFLTASFFAPHPPLFPPKKYFDYYTQQQLPPAAHGDWVDWKSLPAPKKLATTHRVLLEGEVLHNFQAGYFGLISQLDDQVAPLIQEFKARSQKQGRPWVIIFMTDHGELLGDHGFCRKCEPYEGSANIPFVVAGSPELGFKAGLRSQEVVCLEDVMPTVLELAGVKPPSPMDGICLLPTLRGEKGRVREWLHLEHAPCYSQEQAFHALTDGRYKYIWRPLNGAEQLFDLQADAHEEHDLSRDAAAQVMLLPWRARLIKLLVGRPEGFSDGSQLIAGRPYPPLQQRREL